MPSAPAWLVILLVFFTLAILGGRGGRSGSMAKTLGYLKNTEGLIAVKAMDGEKRALIVFNSDSKNAGNFEKVAHYAAVRLARDWPDCEVLLARNRADQVVYRVRVRAGEHRLRGRTCGRAAETRSYPLTTSSGRSRATFSEMPLATVTRDHVVDVLVGLGDLLLQALARTGSRPGCRSFPGARARRSPPRA